MHANHQAGSGSEVVQRLRLATKDVHARLHVHPMTQCLAEDSITTQKYLRVLEAFYGFYCPLEIKLVLLQNVYTLASRTEMIANDLRHYAYSPARLDDLASCYDLPEISSAPAYLGYCYVVEGSSLGGQLISKNLKKHLDNGEAQHARFFSPYGKETGNNWRAFTSYLTQQPLTEDEIATTISGAVDTFQSLETWLWRCHEAVS